MKRRIAFLVLVAALTLAFGIIAAACGDGDEGGGGGGGGLTLEEYFQQLGKLDDEFDERSNALNQELQGLNGAEALERAPEILREQVEVIEGFASDLAALEPPAEVADAHEEAVATSRDAAAAFKEALGEAAAAASLDELIALFDSAELNATVERADEACSRLQGIADDRGIEVDLDCAD